MTLVVCCSQLFKGHGPNYICSYCINECVKSLSAQSDPSESKSAVTISHSEICDCDETDKSEISPQEEQWNLIAAEFKNDTKQLLSRGKVWLRTYPNDRFAGAVIAKLLDITPTAQLLHSAETWLAEFPNEDSVLSVVAMLLKHAPTNKIVRLANRYMKLAEGPGQVRQIIKQIIDGPYRAGLFKQLNLLLERCPNDWDWRFALYSGTREPIKGLDNLTAKWLRLNVNNPDVFFAGLVALTHSPAVIEAAFEWSRSRRGGRSSERMPRTIADLLRASRWYQPSILPAVVRFARRWLNANPDHVECGPIYGSLLSVTRSKKDIRSAKTWHAAHAESEKAWFVISDLLSAADWSSESPDAYAVEQAKVLLRQQKISEAAPRLVGSLLRVVQDEETIGWAKEVYSRTGLQWILSLLLLRAADADCIARANQDFDNWIDSSMETEMLYSLLWADPENKRALKRAKQCVRKNPKDRYAKALATFLQKTASK
jgi:hypothetical protein